MTYSSSHVIDVQVHSAIKQNHRRFSPKVLEAFKNSAAKFKREGLIEPSDGGWCNPVVMAKKPNGEFRLCIDFIRLNRVAKKDAHPMRNMSDILNELRLAQYISKIDLNQAFHEILLTAERPV